MTTCLTGFYYFLQFLLLFDWFKFNTAEQQHWSWLLRLSSHWFKSKKTNATRATSCLSLISWFLLASKVLYLSIYLPVCPSVCLFSHDPVCGDRGRYALTLWGHFALWGQNLLAPNNLTFSPYFCINYRFNA